MKSLILHPLRLSAAHDRRLKVMRVPFKVQPASVEYWLHGLQVETPHDHPIFRDKDGKGWSQCGPFEPPYAHGEVRFVREACYICRSTADGSPLCDPPVVYYADGARKMPEYPFVRNAQSMPSRAARLTITFLNPRPERVQDATTEDIGGEGVVFPPPFIGVNPYDGSAIEHPDIAMDPWQHHERFWDTIYPCNPWAENPWVWRYAVEIGRTR